MQKSLHRRSGRFYRRRILFFLLSLVTNTELMAQSDAAIPLDWAVNGRVLTTAVKGDTLFMAGDFSMVGKTCNYGAIVDNNGDIISPDLQLNGLVSAGISDGAGGWIIGGDFTSVLGQPRKGVAHIKADGTLGTWLADLDGNFADGGLISEIARWGSTIYLAGTFTAVNGVLRKGLAAVDAVTGVVSSWDPAPNGTVYGMEMDGTNMYIYGDFNMVGTQSRKYLAAINQSTGAVLTWNPNPSLPVETIGLSGGILYIGGNFRNIMGTARNYAVAVNTSTFTLTTWNPTANGRVTAMYPVGTSVYLVGAFTSLKGSAGTVVRNGIGAVNATTAVATAFYPVSALTNQLNTIGLLIFEGGAVYVNGRHMAPGLPQPYKLLASYDPATGAATGGIDPQPGSWVSTIIPGNSSNYFIGGAFTLLKGVSRGNAAAVKINEGLLLDWDPKPDGTVYSMIYGNGNLYMGGSFNNIVGVERKKLAAVNINTGDPTEWAPSIDGYIRRLLIHNSTLYIGGAFSTVNAASRKNLASFDLNTGNLNNWDPQPDDMVNDMAANISTLYVGGSFKNIGSTPRNHLAEIDMVSAAPTAFDPDMENTVYSMDKSGSTLYVGGYFNYVNGGVNSRMNAAAFNTTNGSLLPWNPGPNSNVEEITVRSNIVYMGGYFSEVGGQSRSGLALVHPVNGSVFDWAPKFAGTVFSFSFYNDKLITGGQFGQVNNKGQIAVAMFTNPVVLPLTWGDISVSLVRNQALLSWTTTQEMNTRNFIVQYSSDAAHWKDLGSIVAAGNSNAARKYNYLHTSPVAGNNYYRLVQYDIDGKSTLSRIVSIRTGAVEKGFLVMGNPVTNGTLRFQLGGAADAMLFSMDGKMLMRKHLPAGSHSMDLSAYPKGLYTLQAGKEVRRVLFQ